jgi:hypothetical protein
MKGRVPNTFFLNVWHVVDADDTKQNAKAMMGIMFIMMSIVLSTSSGDTIAKETDVRHAQEKVMFIMFMIVTTRMKKKMMMTRTRMWLG